MTKEEAIAELREDKALYESDICHAGDGTPDGRLLQALDMAIEALANLKGNFESADAVQGEWEHWGSPFSDESEVIDTIVCSVCGARFIEPKDEPKGEYNYCPNCGADMRKKENE